MFKKGDKYIHFTKYGGVNRGEVKEIGYTTIFDTAHKTIYYQNYIVTTKNFILYLDGSDGKIYKIESELTDKQNEKIINTFKGLSQRKAERQTEIIEALKTNKLQGGERA